MAKKQSALGKDFYSILDDNILGMKDGAATTLRLSSIEPRGDQPRKQFDRESLQALADSIAAYGVLQPILVRQNVNFEGNYEIVAGERRWRAAKMAGLSEIPAIVLDGDDQKIAQIALIENLQREDLNPIEEAAALQALIDRFNMTQEEVAQQVGKSRSAVTNALRLLELPDTVLDMVKNGDITAGHARALLGLNDQSEVITLARRAMNKELSVRETERLVQHMNAAGREPVIHADFDGSIMRKTWVKELEDRTRELTGRRVRIFSDKKRRSVELFYTNDEDLERLLEQIAGEEIFKKNT